MTTANVVDVGDDLLEHLCDVIIVQGVDDLAPLTLADHEAEVSHQPQLMGDGGILHPDRGCELADRCRPRVEPGEDSQPARRRESLHGLGGGAGIRGVVEQPFKAGVVSMGHRHGTLPE